MYLDFLTQDNYYATYYRWKTRICLNFDYKGQVCCINNECFEHIYEYRLLKKKKKLFVQNQAIVNLLTYQSGYNDLQNVTVLNYHISSSKIINYIAFKILKILSNNC